MAHAKRTSAPPASVASGETTPGDALTEKDPWEMWQNAQQKVAKWERKADKAVTGAQYQEAMIRKRHWEEQEMMWHERWLMG